jgi:hypothetical protein
MPESRSPFPYKGYQNMEEYKRRGLLLQEEGDESAAPSPATTTTDAYSPMAAPSSVEVFTPPLSIS